MGCNSLYEWGLLGQSLFMLLGEAVGHDWEWSSVRMKLGCFWPKSEIGTGKAAMCSGGTYPRSFDGIAAV